MKNLLLLMLVAFSMLLAQCKVVESVFGDKVKFELATVQPYFALVNIEASDYDQLKVERILFLDDKKITDTLSVITPLFEVPLYKMYGDFKLTLLGQKRDSKTWGRLKELLVRDRSPRSKYLTFPFSTTDTVAISIESLPSLSNFSCNTLQGSGWNNVVPTRGTSYTYNNQVTQSNTTWHITMTGNSNASQFYYVVISTGTQVRTNIATVVEIAPNGNVYLKLPGSNTCISQGELIDQGIWNWTSNDGGIHMYTILTSPGHYELNIFTPYNAEVTISTCARCLDN